ncbi:MAG: hypothetical protein ACRCX2_11255 [Paraclostridium sp.]
MSDCCLIKKVATVDVYENKNEVRAYGFMVGDKATPIMRIRFNHLFGEDNLSDCRLRWVLVDDLGSLLVGDVPISINNTAEIALPDALFNSERRIKVQLTIASCDGTKLLNLQQFTDLRVINNLGYATQQEPLVSVLTEQIKSEIEAGIATIRAEVESAKREVANED